MNVSYEEYIFKPISLISDMTVMPFTER